MLTVFKNTRDAKEGRFLGSAELQRQTQLLALLEQASACFDEIGVLEKSYNQETGHWLSKYSIKEQVAHYQKIVAALKRAEGVE